jgi:hypothetical protein
MTHPRQTIREAAKTLLLNQGPWEDRVFLNRMKAISQRPGQRSNRSQLPALVIYTRNETAEVFNVAPREYRCVVELVFEFLAADSDQVDVELDNAAEIIERIVARNDTLQGTADDTEYVSTNITIVDQGEVPIGAVGLTFQATYYREAPDEEFTQTLPDMDTVHVEYSLDNAQPNPADRAQTTITGLSE